MVAGKEVVRLCEHIVRQSFGDEVCRVTSTLLNRGRLSASTLIALSGLSSKTVLTSLVVLCQHGLVLSSGGSSLSPPKEEMYEFNVEQCLLRLRWGRILALTYERLGKVALDVIKQILLFGKLQLPDIIHACGGQHDPARAAQITDATIDLVRRSFLHPTSPLLQVLIDDQIERRFAMKRQDRKAHGESGLLRPIDVENIQSESTWEITEERRALRSMDAVLIERERPGKKKKSKAAEEFDYSLKPDVLLEVNYDRYGVLMRDELIVKAAEDRWNKGAAEVVRGVLEAALDQHSDLKASRTYTSVTVAQIMDKIPEKSHKYLFAGLALSNTSSKSALEYVRHYLQVLSGQDIQPTTGSRFLTKNDAAEDGYTVELQGICVRLRANMMMDLVRERLGTRQARVLATVAKAHHISEQMIRDCAMIPLKEARIALAELQKMSLIETSEIPKSVNAKRTNLTATSEHHRWGMDLPRAYNAMLANVYKTLGNILQRRASEYARRQASIDREGAAMHVGGRDVLIQKDQDELRELDDVVRKLTLAEERCEMVVFIIRDLPGWPTGQGSDI